MAIAYIGIGSNLGNRQENCLRAIELLQKKGIIVTKRSSLYETEPWGVKDQPRFINMAVEIDTSLEPKELLKILKNIEKELGKEKSSKWGPRIIDLDILLFDDIILNEDNLKIPHPLMHERDFVLRPLCEIAPDIYHPLLKMRMYELMQKIHRKSPEPQS
ncbi:MAG: 2-amino-4-hydroxy-6-hydroxymethyldihydropteridine diphosphokinase [Nitrospirae bacterium RBG_13_41_22]|nr:MAG: 2-amino-4-hydroxy-6-hydroxymethyldihydropteridine diphosphokinase [Nitrospirae bacterium RBG_13_41_22]